MSLVRFNGTGNWDVVLQDDARRAVVLFDRDSQRLTLVNNARVLSTVQPVGGFTGPARCETCGQLLPVDIPGHQEPAYRPTPIRDANYFHLLELEMVEPRLESAVPLTRAETPRETPRGTPSTPITPSTPTGHQTPVNGISDSAFSQGYFDKFFVSTGLLGRGSRGAVYLVEHVLDGVSLGVFALKKVAVGDDHTWLERVLSEVSLLRMLSHPNLVRYNHVWLETSSLSTFGPVVPCAYILQEYCNGGTLEEYMQVSQGSRRSGGDESRRERIRRMSRTDANDDVIRLPLDQIVSFMRDIVSGVRYLHHNQIIHRDLKPSNCLLTKTAVPGELPTVLVSDFGEGQVEGRDRTGTGSTGTLEYCAPEVVQPINGRLCQFSKKTDMFSVGMILHYLCFSMLPYSDAWQARGDLDTLTREVAAFPGFEMRNSNSKFARTDLDHRLVTMLSALLSRDPSTRPSADEVYETLEQIWLDMRTGSAIPTNVLNDEVVARINHVPNITSIPTPTLVDRRLLLPAGSRPNWFAKYAPRNEKLLAVKTALLCVKIATIYKLPPSGYSQAMLVAMGIELPILGIYSAVRSTCRSACDSEDLLCLNDRLSIRAYKSLSIRAYNRATITGQIWPQGLEPHQEAKQESGASGPKGLNEPLTYDFTGKARSTPEKAASTCCASNHAENCI